MCLGCIRFRAPYADQFYCIMKNACLNYRGFDIEHDNDYSIRLFYHSTIESTYWKVAENGGHLYWNQRDKTRVYMVLLMKPYLTIPRV